MKVKLTVPIDLGGSSLLGVHNWIKSQVARRNPGGSVDYTITDMSGNQLTLSDVARRPKSEIMVNVIDGIKSNPQGYLSPVPGLEMEYPVVPRSGNDIMMLMPDDLDPTLVHRIVAEQGLNRGLHTLNRLLLMQDPENRSVSPQTAAILQMGDKLRMSRIYNARSNPSDRTPFTQRTPSYYSPEKALGDYVKDYTGADNITVAESRVLARDAQLANKYGLNRDKICIFARNVLAEYLYAASANRGLLRTITRNNPDLRMDRELMNRLIAIFPQQARVFYEGATNVFVANPMFIYPAYADTLITQRQINTILEFARGYPQNMRGRNLPRGMANLVYDISQRNYFILWAQKAVGLRRQSAVDSATHLDDQIAQEGLGRISRRFASDPEQRRQAYFNLLSRDRPLAYFSNIGGMYPTIPSKWPPALIYAIMDGFLEKLGEIVSLDDPHEYNFSATRLRGQMREETGTMLYVPNPFTQARVSPDRPLQDWTEPGAPLTVEIEYPFDYQQLVNSHIGWDQIRAMFGIRTKNSLNDMGVNIAGSVGNNLVRAMAVDAIHRERMDQGMAGAGIVGDIQISGEDGVSLLEMAYHIAEIAQVKYNYNARGDDFMFIMAMCQISLDCLRQQRAAVGPVPAVVPRRRLPRIGLPRIGLPQINLPPLNLPPLPFSRRRREEEFDRLYDERRDERRYERQVDAVPEMVDLPPLEDIEVLPLPGAVEINDDIEVAPDVIDAQLELDLDELLADYEQGDDLELNDLLAQLSQEGSMDVIRRLPNGHDYVARLGRPEGGPAVMVRMNPPSPRVERIMNLVRQRRRVGRDSDRRVVQAIKDSLTPTAKQFLDGNNEVSIKTITSASEAFDAAVEQLISAYKECIEQVSEAVDNNINGVFSAHSIGLITYDEQRMEDILRAISVTDAMASNAKMNFANRLDMLRVMANTVRGVAGASPGIAASIERAASIDLNATDLIVDFSNSIEKIGDALSEMDSDSPDSNGLVKLYDAVIQVIVDMMEMLRAIDALIQSERPKADARSLKLIVTAYRQLLNTIENDLEVLDPKLYESQIIAIKSLSSKAEYGSLKESVEKLDALI